MKKDWYVIQVKNGFENRILRYLSQLRDRLNLNVNDVEFKIPTEKYIQFKDGEKKIRKKSLLPGYMLVGVSNSLSHNLKTGVTGLPYVIGFVGNKGRIVPLKENEVETIFGKISDINSIDVHMDQFCVGEEVIIVDGPFAEFVGNVSQVNDGRLIVDVSIFGRVTPVELGVLQVERNKERD